ncbi:MAG: DUF3341 domain-containing protein [Anaerolineales bacterium]|nr:DUF3341 domain-containing protein [Anaerolineales bacterium]
MTETKQKEVDLLALFSDVAPAADAVEQLRLVGVRDDEINVLSGVPVTGAMLGREPHPTNVPKIAMGGAILGFLTGAFLTFVTPYWYPYPIRVSTQAYVPAPPTVIVLFEITMLGMLLSTFVGVFMDSFFPNYRPMKYVPEISDGKIAVFVECESGDQNKIIDLLKKLGAESVKPAEAQHL